MKEEESTIEIKNEDKKNVIQIGDIAVASSKDSLKKCSAMIKDLIKDVDIQNYLSGSWAKTKILGSGIG